MEALDVRELVASLSGMALLGYVLAVIGATLLIRVIMCYLRCIEKTRSPHVPRRMLWSAILGFARKDDSWEIRELSDFLFPFWVGTFELAVYPLLMSAGGTTPIGAWIGLKTVAQWNRWREDRSPFNRYLIGNALTLVGSYLIARYLIM
jgi:hypothetical protein